MEKNKLTFEDSIFNQKTNVGSSKQIKPLSNTNNPTVNKITEHAKNNTANNAKIGSIQQSTKKCTNFCRQTGFFIQPLRYVAIRGNIPKLPPNLGENVFNISLSYFKYGIEMIDTGYIYRLVKKQSGTKVWAGYKVTPKGYLSYFPIGMTAPVSVPEFNCKSEGHDFAASLICVEHDDKDPAQYAYIIHTHVPLSPEKLDEYKNNADTFAQDGKWQKIEITAWIAGNISQKHCITGQKTNSIYNVGSTFGIARFNKLKKVMTAKPYNFMCMALYDPIGITKSINDYRNISFSNLFNFLKKIENKVSNEQRLFSAQAIDSIENLVTNKIMNQKNSYLESAVNDTIIMDYASKHDSSGDLYKGDGYEIYEKANAIWDKASEAKKSAAIAEYYAQNGVAVDRNIGSNSDRSRQEGKILWENKYKKYLDLAAKNTFLKNVENVSKTCGDLVEQVEVDHIAWLSSKAMIKALHAYDQKKQVPYGNLFNLQLSEAMHGMSGTKKGQLKIYEWMGEKTFDEKNIYMRILCYNQEKLKSEYEKVVGSITSLTFDDTQGLLKQTLSVFVASNQLWEEWLKDSQNLSYSKNRLVIPVQKVCYWIVETLNSVIKSGIKYSDEKVAAKLARTTFMIKAYAPTTFNNIPSYSILYRYDEQSLLRAARNPTDAFAVVNSRRIGIDKQIQSAMSSASEHGKTRITIVVAALEVINLASQQDKFTTKELLNSSLQITAAMFATISALMEATGLGLQRVYQWDQAANIRLAGSVLAVIGGALAVLMEGINAFKELNSKSTNWYLFALYLAKVGSAFSLLVVSLWLLTSQVLKKELEKKLLGKLVLAGALSNYIGWGLIFLEYYLKNYVFDNDMQVWCRKSSFALAATAKSKYKTQAEEEKAFNDAIVSV